MKTVKMTQRKLAGGYIRGWLSGENDDAGFVRVIEQLLDKSQNPPPDGYSDGSINDGQRQVLTDLMVAVANKRIYLTSALNALGLDEEGNTRR